MTSSSTPQVGVQSGSDPRPADVPMTQSTSSSSGLKRDSVGSDIETPEAKRGVVESTQEKRQTDTGVIQGSPTPKKSRHLRLLRQRATLR